MADIPPYPLYNRTYHLYRLSPLHHGEAPLLDDKSLRTHAKRLKEQLKGDNVRGVQVDFETAQDTARRGPLEQCVWETVGDEDAWIDHHAQSVEPDASQLTSAVTPERARGIQVSLEYEKQTCNALLLRDPDATASPAAGFTSLPLLLVKMPLSIRDIFLDYLRTAFDAHVAPLRLPSAFITSSLETYFKRLSSSTSTQTIQDVIRQLNVQLAFPTATSLLKHVELTIAGADVPGFVSRGKVLGGTDKPFTTALSQYLQTHLALDMSNSKAHISRITCNSFHLSTERLKLVAPEPLADNSFSDDVGASQDVSAGQLAVHDFYTALVKEAAGSGKFLPESLASGQRDDTPSSTASVEAGRRKRAASSAATLAANHKKAKSRGKENGTTVNRDESMVDA